MLLLIIIQLPTPFVILHRRRPRTLTVVTFNINFAGKAQINLETREDPLHTLDSGGGAGGGGGAGEWWLWCWCWLQWCARRAQGPSSPVLDGQRTSAPPVSTQPPLLYFPYCWFPPASLCLHRKSAHPPLPSISIPSPPPIPTPPPPRTPSSSHPPILPLHPSPCHLPLSLPSPASLPFPPSAPRIPTPSPPAPRIPTPSLRP